jgi:hypothetical protein
MVKPKRNLNHFVAADAVKRNEARAPWVITKSSK